MSECLHACERKKRDWENIDDESVENVFERMSIKYAKKKAFNLMWIKAAVKSELNEC